MNRGLKPRYKTIKSAVFGATPGPGRRGPLMPWAGNNKKGTPIPW